MPSNMRKISLQESRDMSLKLEELLEQEAKINDRKSKLNRENKVELDRCLEEQDRIRTIIKTGEINEDEVIQEEMFDGDEVTSFNVTLTFSSMRSGMPICEIELQDMLNFHINGETKADVRSAVNEALYDVKHKALGYTKMSAYTSAPQAQEPQFAESLNSEVGEVGEITNELDEAIQESPAIAEGEAPQFHPSMEGVKPGRKAKMKKVFA